MGLFDDLMQNVQDIQESVGGNVEDLTNQAGDLGEQAQNLKDSVLPGESGDNEQQ